MGKRTLYIPGCTGYRDTRDTAVRAYEYDHQHEDGLGIKVDNDVMIGKQISRKWVLQISCPEVVVRSTASYDVWHQRLGHPNDRVMCNMAQLDVVLGKPKDLGKPTPCETCENAKYTKSTVIGPTFRQNNWILHLVVADLCGPFQE